MKRKIAVVVGTRPEVIKMSMVYLTMRRDPAFTPVLVSTGQHRQMLDQACKVFGIVPDFDLGLMRKNNRQDDLLGRVVSGASRLFQEIKPDAVLVQGDTTSVLGSALASFYNRVPVGHVEAGLRTHSFDAPWPEEMNRRLTDPISRWCFAPTPDCQANLLKERIPKSSIFVTGNTVVDALLFVRRKVNSSPAIGEGLLKESGISSRFAREFIRDDPGRTSGKSPFLLVTCHRRESFGEGLENVCRAIRGILAKNRDVGILFPVHPNPAVEGPVWKFLGDSGRVQLTKPLSYETFVYLMERCAFILTDSGGVQEEAPSLGKSVLVMREKTERPEGIRAGTSRLVGTHFDRIESETLSLLRAFERDIPEASFENPFGDGKASQYILRALKKTL